MRRSRQRLLVCHGSVLTKGAEEGKEVDVWQQKRIQMRRLPLVVSLVVLLTNIAYAQTTDFFELAKTGTPEQIKNAIFQGAKANIKDKYGWTPLFFSAWQNTDPNVITTLLNAGADIEAQDVDGNTPLLIAAWDNTNPEVVITLLMEGANPAKKNNIGKSAFDYAKENTKMRGTRAIQKLEEVFAKSQEKAMSSPPERP